MSAYSDALKAQAAAFRAWGHTIDVLAGEHEKREARAAAPKPAKSAKPAIPEHEYKPFTLTPGMLAALKTKRWSAAAGAEICRHCGLVRTCASPYRFYYEYSWRATRPACVGRQVKP